MFRRRLLLLTLSSQNHTTNKIIIIKRLRKGFQKQIYYNQMEYSCQVIKTIEDRLLDLVTSTYVYKFNCSWGDIYTRRIIRRVYYCTTEHYLSWLSKEKLSVINSIILVQLMDTRYQVSLDEVCKIMQRVTLNLLHVLMVCLLRTTEAKEIHIHKYMLHTVKTFTLPLSTLVIDTEMSFILTLTKPILSTKNSKSFFISKRARIMD